MEKLLHERLREYADDSCRVSFKTDTKQIIGMTSLDAEALADEIERRYIPRPRFEDGEPLESGSEIDFLGRAEKVVSYLVAPNIREDVDYGARSPYVTLHLKCGASHNVPLGEPLKRPTPKVLDADGVPCKEGETVFDIHHGTELLIKRITDDRRILCKYEGDRLGNYLASELTHEKPVFDANNERICKGDTVWGTLLGDKHEVSLVKNGCVYLDDGSICFEPNQLTHKEPDSIERILDDATIDPRIYYNDHIGHDVGLHDDAFIIEKFAQHLIKRAALIERGA